MKPDEHRASRHTGLDTADRRRSAGGGSQRAAQLRVQGNQTGGADRRGGGCDLAVCDRDQFSDLAFAAAGDPWGDDTRTRVNRNVGGDRAHRTETGDKVRTADRGPGDKGLNMPNPVLVGCLIVLVITVAVQFVAGALI